MLVVAALAGAAEPARACSCVPPDPWSFLEKADGAFVGRLVSRQEGDEGRAVLTFSVERAVKGKIGRTVEVETASSGAGCGIETSVGREIGLFLVREGDGWFGHLCWQVEPEDLLAAASLPAPNGRGPVALLVGGRFGPARTLALDAKGRTLAYGMGSGEALDFSVCPGGRRVAEIVDRDASSWVAIRELPTLRLVRRQRLGLRYYTDTFHCVSADGEQIAIFSSDTGANGRITRFRPGTSTTIWRGNAFYASFRKGFAYVQVLDRGWTRLVTVDLRAGTATRLGTVPVCDAYQLDLNRAGTRLAGDTFCEGVGDPRLVVIDFARRPISARTIPLPTQCCGFARWLRDDRFAYFSGGRILVYSAALRLSARVSGWTGGYAALIGPTAYGIGRNGALVSSKLPSGPVRVVRRLPGRPGVIVSATG